MICDICQKRDATVFIKKVESGGTVKYNLCEICAAKLTEPSIDLSEFHEELFSSITDMLAGFSDMGESETITEEKNCPKCGSGFNDFQRTGRFGCDMCYETFKDELTPLLRRLQGAVQHSGKNPPGMEKQMEIKKLKMTLNEAVEKEEYERAAVIRDKIKEIEKAKKILS